MISGKQGIVMFQFVSFNEPVADVSIERKNLCKFAKRVDVVIILGIVIKCCNVTTSSS